jgi:hypothetical protein
MKRTTCLADVGKAELAKQVILLELEQGSRRIGKKLGIGRPQTIAMDELRGPDTERALRAKSLVADLSPPFLLHHCLRTHAFARAIARHAAMKIDEELLYLACMLHDLGLTDHCEEGEQSFEIRGAQAARKWCLEQGLEEQKADLVHEAIALHTSLSSAQREPEIALVHFGAGVDVIGYHIEDITPDTIAEIILAWPRLDFKQEFISALQSEMKRGHSSPLATQWKLGFRQRIQAAPFSE